MDEGRVRDPHRPGFRFSATDAAAMGLGGLMTWLSREWLGVHALLPILVLAHFFLFCNVFRVRRRYELAWAGFFVANYAGWTASGAFTWWGVLGVQFPATILIIVLEMRSPEYHGVWCNRIRRAGTGASKPCAKPSTPSTTHESYSAPSGYYNGKGKKGEEQGEGGTDPSR